MAKNYKKKDLGKGIRALLTHIDTESAKHPEKAVQDLAKTVNQIPIDLIEVNPFQPRSEFDKDALNELASSIKVHGLIQPITVRKLEGDRFQLISGERRLRAAKIAGLTEIPAYIRIANDQEMLEMALVENIQREDLNAMEIAFTYKRLIEECELTHESLSDRVGKNRSTVTNYLRLLKLAPEIQQGIKNKSISMGHARALVGVEDLSLQKTFFKKIVKENLSVREIENLIRAINEPKKKKKKTSTSLPLEYQSVQEQLRKHFGSKVQLKRKKSGGGQIIIGFHNDEDLNRVLDLIED